MMADYSQLLRADQLYGSAQEHLAQGRLQEAVADLTAALQILPEAPDLLLMRAQAYQHVGAITEALEDFRAAAQAFTKMLEADRINFELYAQRAVAYLQLGALPEAERDFTSAIALLPYGPRQLQLRFRRGLLALQLTSLENQRRFRCSPEQVLETARQAEADMSALIAVQPHELQPYYYRGLALMKASSMEAYLGLAQAQDTHKQAAADFSLVISKSPAEVDPYYQRGLIRMQLGEVEGALSDFSAAIERAQPPIAQLHYQRGLVYLGENEYRRAIADFSIVIGLVPDSSDAYYERGFAYLLLGMYKEAKEDLDQCLKLSLEDANAHLYRGYSLYRLGRWQEALADLDRCLELQPRRPYAYLIRGETKYRLGEFEQAQADISFYLQEEQQPLPAAFASRAQCLLEQKQYEAAIADFDEALSRGLSAEMQAGCHYNIAIAYRRLGRHWEAIQHYDQVLEVNDKDVAALTGRGWAYLALDEFALALAAFQAAEELMNPPSASVLIGFGHCLNAEGLRDEALAQYTRAIEQESGEHAAALYSRAMCYLEQGDPAQAVADFTQAIALKPDWARAYADRAESHRKAAEQAWAAQDRATALREQALAEQDDAKAGDLGLEEAEEGGRFYARPEEDDDESRSDLQKYLDAEFGGDFWKQEDWGDEEEGVEEN